MGRLVIISLCAVSSIFIGFFKWGVVSTMFWGCFAPSVSELYMLEGNVLPLIDHGAVERWKEKQRLQFKRFAPYGVRENEFLSRRG